jgi:ribosomal protein S18 acetylase RimI-like enzyme
MHSFHVVRGDIHDLDRIKPLWEELNLIHSKSSPYFRERYEGVTWDKRKADLIKKSGEINLDYVIDKNTDAIIGYCISSIERDDPTNGEIDSILIDDRYRKSGLGKQLMENAIQWLDGKGVKVKRLMVSVGNEKVLDFYKQFDFYPLHIILQKLENK